MQVSSRMAIGIRVFFLLIFPTLFHILHASDAAHHDRQQLPSAMIVGTVYCDTCFHHKLSKASRSISGALVAVECGGDDLMNKPSFRMEAKTNKHGVFHVRLPSEEAKHIKWIKTCSVKLISSSEPFCAVASSATSSAPRLTSARRGGVHVFSAGFFTFKPLKQPELCYQKPSTAGDSNYGEAKISSVPLPGLLNINLPPLPQLPTIPQLPPLPNFPNYGPPGEKKPEDSPNKNTPSAAEENETRPAATIPPPSPSLVPPSRPRFGRTSPPYPFWPPTGRPTNPLQPPPPALPTFTFQPPPPLPLLGNVPPAPMVTPSPPAFRLPPFPFPPFPFFPGIPPAFPTKRASP